MIAIGYIRVSSEQQVAEGVSLEAQRAKIGAYCALHDLDFRNIFRDEGLSGKRYDNRPGLQDALNAVCEHKGVLVVYSLSRLARSTNDAIEIVKRIEKCGANLASITEQIDTTSGMGRFVFRLMASLGELERDLIGERTRFALQHKRGKGERVGRVPVGQELDHNGPKNAKGLPIRLLPNDDEQRIVKDIVMSHRAGVGYRAIAARLNQSGTPAKHGGKWSAKVVRDICRRKPIQQVQQEKP